MGYHNGREKKPHIRKQEERNTNHTITNIHSVLSHHRYCFALRRSRRLRRYGHWRSWTCRRLFRNHLDDNSFGVSERTRGRFERECAIKTSLREGGGGVACRERSLRERMRPFRDEEVVERFAQERERSRARKALQSHAYTETGKISFKKRERDHKMVEIDCIQSKLQREHPIQAPNLRWPR